MRLAKAIESRFGTRPRIRLGGLQVLDVYVDGRLVYSRKQEGTAATDDAILARIR